MGSAQVYNVNGNSQTASTFILPTSNSVGNTSLVKYNSEGIVLNATIVSGYDINFSSNSCITDSQNNIYIVGRYASNTQVIPYNNIAQNTLSPSSIALPIVPYTSPNLDGFIIKYKSL